MSDRKQHPFPHCNCRVTDGSESRTECPDSGGAKIETRMRNKIGLCRTLSFHIWQPCNGESVDSSSTAQLKGRAQSMVLTECFHVTRPDLRAFCRLFLHQITSHCESFCRSSQRYLLFPKF